MKRILSLALSLVVATVAFAQGETKPQREKKQLKDYSEYLPKAGDVAIGFSLNPLANFVGNMFNGNEWNILENLAGEPMLCPTPDIASIMAKYMLTDQLGLKVNLGFGCNIYSRNGYIVDEAAVLMNPLSEAKVIDTYKVNKLSGSIALGVEYHVGKQLPVQGVFGAGLLYAVGHETHRYKYGNAITELNQTPAYNYDVFQSTTVFRDLYYMQGRVLSDQAEDLIHRVGAYASVGIEWFVAPRISLGANVNLNICYTLNPARATIYEGWNPLTSQVEQYTELVAPASHGFTFSTDN
ncbi:MAG: hypothetical protein ACI4TV_04865, partial [Paludibacteraceae bacterium]